VIIGLFKEIAKHRAISVNTVHTGRQSAAENPLQTAKGLGQFVFLDETLTSRDCKSGDQAPHF